MANKRFWLGISVLVFGFAVVGCDNGTTNGGGAASLNGIWEYVGDGGEWTDVWEFNNNNVEFRGYNGQLDFGDRGTFTVSGNTINITWTAEFSDGQWRPVTAWTEVITFSSVL